MNCALTPLLAALFLMIMLFPDSLAMAQDRTQDGFADPPNSARLRAYWWWLNGNVTKEAITRDLEQMKTQGFGGALICDADGASQDGNDRVPHGPDFFSAQWRELYRHTLREAHRLGLEMSLNIQSGWNLGGPTVTAEDAAKKLAWSELPVEGPRMFEEKLPEPKSRDGYYRDLFVIAYPVKTRPPGTVTRPPIQNWEQKAMHRALHFSAPDTSPLLQDAPATPGEEDASSSEVLDLTSRLDQNGVLRWAIPAGPWMVLRIGCTIGDHSRVSTSSDGWKGFALDVLDAGAFSRYWDAVIDPLIADAGPLAGRTLKYLHTDSWEVEAVNWTPTLREEFRRRRGYDFLPYLPVVTGRIIGSRLVSNRFLNDFRKTLGDLAIDNHYRLFRERAHRYGLQIHPESGGPHAVPVDAQRCLGFNDVPMSEFWALSWRHRVGESNRFFVKQPASAAHTYGRRLVAAEGFTTIGPHWQETLWDNLKPSFDRASCEGLNLLVWHAFTCSPAEMGLPGQEYFAGTHFNPNSTWWSRSKPFLTYINRCQFLLQQGLFVADVCYYYGDHVPNFAQLKRSDPARVLPGFDYDVITEEAILTRLRVESGRLVLPDGMSYRMLVLPDRPQISLPILRKLSQFIEAGATIIGPKPLHATSLQNYPACDEELTQLTTRLWGKSNSHTPSQRKVGFGRVIQNQSAREVLLASGISPDFEFEGGDSNTALDYIHRRVDATELYFVANRSNRLETVTCAFRVTGKQPELWDPVTGQIRHLVSWTCHEGRTTLPLEFPPFGSLFIVFRHLAQTPSPAIEKPNFPQFQPLHELEGPWTVAFDPVWGGPAAVVFAQLTNWATHSETGIKYYSGTATYRKSFDLPKGTPSPQRNPQAATSQTKVYLDLGSVKELAEVRLNGRNLGVLWSQPFRVEITGLLKPDGNQLEIDVVNFWPNRIIGDQMLPSSQRRTRTNIRKLTRDTPLMDSGLLGPVRLLETVRN
jgi:hypothetical protein